MAVKEASMRPGISVWLSVLFIAALARPASVDAETLVVDLGGAGPFRDIQSAIDASADGDTVLVKPGEYVIEEPINFKGKEIVVRGESGAEATTIRMSAAPKEACRRSLDLGPEDPDSRFLLGAAWDVAC